MKDDYDYEWWNIGADDEKALTRIVQDNICVALDHEYRNNLLFLDFDEKTGEPVFYVHGSEKPEHLKIFKDGRCVTDCWGANFCGIDAAKFAAEAFDAEDRQKFAEMLYRMAKIVDPKANDAADG